MDAAEDSEGVELMEVEVDGEVEDATGVGPYSEVVPEWLKMPLVAVVEVAVLLDAMSDTSVIHSKSVF